MFVIASFLVSYGIERALEEGNISDFLYFLFPFITTTPELFVFAYGLTLGKSGTAVSIGTVLGEPFIVLTLGILAYKALKKGPIEREPRSQRTLVFFFALSALFIFSYYVVRLGLLALAVVFLIYEASLMLGFKGTKLKVSDASAFGYTAAGIVMLGLTGKYVTETVISISSFLKIHPALTSFILVPAVSSLPELIAPFVFKSRKSEERLSPLLSELPISVGLYPPFLIFSASFSVPLKVVVGLVLSMIQSLIIICEERRGLSFSHISGALLFLAFISTLI